MEDHVKSINFDPFDFGGMLKIMDEHGNSDTMYPGINENMEETYISVFPEKIVVETHQHIGWVRINTYWRDGTSEETFKGKWR